MKRNIVFIVSILIFTILLASCGAESNEPPIPEHDKYEYVFQLNDDGESYSLVNVYFYCSEMLDLVIPSEYNGKPVTAISDKEVANPIGMRVKSLEIPASIVTIAPCTMYYAMTEEINVSPENPVYSSQDGNLYSKDGKELIVYASGKTSHSFEIPDTVESLGENAFAFTYFLKSVTVPNSVKSVHETTFYNANALKEIVNNTGRDESFLGLMPFNQPKPVIHSGESIIQCEDGFLYLMDDENARIIGYIGDESDAVIPCLDKNGRLSFVIDDRAFAFNENLKKITLPLNLDKICYEAFYLTKIEEVVFTDDIDSIARYSFASMERLKKITLPERITNIEEEAFYYCTALESIIIPKGVSSIGANAFTGCEALTIYCKDESQPDTWDAEWNSLPCKVIWNYTN